MFYLRPRPAVLSMVACRVKRAEACVMRVSDFVLIVEYIKGHLHCSEENFSGYEHQTRR